LFPSGKLAERKNGLWEYLLTKPNFIETVMQEANAFNPGLKVVAEDPH
jgi:hypothetical protein